MNHYVVRSVTAGMLWTASVALMVAGDLRISHIVMLWGLFVALVAAIVTGWILVDCAVYRQRIKVDRIVETVARQLQQESKLPRI